MASEINSTVDTIQAAAQKLGLVNPERTERSKTMYNQAVADLYTAALPLIRTIVSTAVSYNVTRQDAEEAVQDAFIQALQGYDPAQGTFRARLSHFAELKLRNMARRKVSRQRTLQAFAQLVQVRTIDPHDEVTFWQYVETMEPTLQQAVRKVVAGYSLSAVAKELGYSDMRVLRNTLRTAISSAIADAV